MLKTTINLEPGKKVYFASDQHFGAPDPKESKIREEHFIRWMDEIKHDAQVLFLMGDLFDFWHEWKHVIPKGYVRVLGKIAELKDRGIHIYFFVGNHDLWMKDYFTTELGIPVYSHPIELSVAGKKFLVGHGDGLGPGDHTYKLLKKVFTNPFAQWLFKWLHPDLGIGLTKAWSGHSRISNTAKNENHFLGDDEWLWQYCKEVESRFHHDYYVFGHRHLPLELAVGNSSTYYNLGEWVSQFTFLEFEGLAPKLQKFEG